MNKRQAKKARTRKGAEALIGRNAYLERENVKLKREVTEVREGLDQVYASFYAIVGAITRCYGETIEGYSVIEFPIDEARKVPDNYEVKVKIEDGKYIICVLPKVDPEAK